MKEVKNLYRYTTTVEIKDGSYELGYVYSIDIPTAVNKINEHLKSVYKPTQPRIKTVEMLTSNLLTD